MGLDGPLMALIVLIILACQPMTYSDESTAIDKSTKETPIVNAPKNEPEKSKPVPTPKEELSSCEIDVRQLRDELHNERSRQFECHCDNVDYD